MEVGNLVKQTLFQDLHRYGIVVSLDVPEPAKLIGPCVKVAFSPRKDHPVGHAPYVECVPMRKLEVISD